MMDSKMLYRKATVLSCVGNYPSYTLTGLPFHRSHNIFFEVNLVSKRSRVLSGIE
jgi:hypothetical protein